MSGPTFDTINSETHKGTYMEHISEKKKYGIYEEYRGAGGEMGRAPRKSRSGHDRSQSFRPMLYVSGPKLSFEGHIRMILHFFAPRSKQLSFFQKQ